MNYTLRHYNVICGLSREVPVVVVEMWLLVHRLNCNTLNNILSLH